MTITLSALQKQRRDTASNWTSNNPTLLAGEWGIESDTKKFKIGDGSTAWQSLEYVPIPDTNRLLEGNLTVGGNFTVNGTSTTIDTTTLTVEDKNIEIGKVSTPSDTTANNGGITLRGTTDKTINWVDSTDSWTFSEHIDLASGKVLKSAGTQFLSPTQYTGNSATTTALATARTIGGVSFDGTANIDLPGVNSIGNQNTTGSAATLTTPRTIAGVSFDGSANISLNNNSITNGAGYIDGSSLNASNLNSGTIPDARFPATLPAISGANLTNLPASTTSVVSDTSPSLGGDLQSNGNDIDFADNDKAIFGTGGDLEISHGSNISTIKDTYGDLRIMGDTIRIQRQAGGENFLFATEGGKTSLYFDGSEKIQTTSSGAAVTGNLNILNSANTTLKLFDSSGDPDSYGFLLYNNGNDADDVLILGVDGDNEQASSHIRFYVDGTSGSAEKFRVNSSGAVVTGSLGIGTSSPSVPLHINSSDNSLAYLQSTDAFAAMYMADTNGSVGFVTTLGRLDIKTGGDASTQGTNAITSMTIKDDGKVGIGTSSPDVKLDVARLGNAWTGQDPVAGTAAHFHNGNNSSSSPAYLGLGAGTASISGINFGDADDADVGRIHYSHSDNSLTFGTDGAAERMRIDSSGRLLIGTSAARSPATIGAFFQIEGTTGNTSSISATRNSADSAGANFVFNKTRGTSVGADVVVNSGDQLGIIRFCGNDGTDSNNTAASVSAFVDGTPGSNDMPGRLVFSTTADGATSPTEHMRIDSSGTVFISTTSRGTDASTSNLAVFGNSSTTTGNVAGSFFGGAVSGERFVLSFSNSNGIVGSVSTHGTQTFFNGTSDYRLKENAVAISDGITRLKKLKPIRFNFITDATTTLDGFLAHEVSEAVPEAVAGQKDGMAGETYYEEGDELPSGKEYGDVKTYSTTKIEPQQLDQTKIVPLLVAAVQELIGKVEALEAA